MNPNSAILLQIAVAATAEFDLTALVEHFPFSRSPQPQGGFLENPLHLGKDLKPRRVRKLRRDNIRHLPNRYSKTTIVTTLCLDRVLPFEPSGWEMWHRTRQLTCVRQSQGNHVIDATATGIPEFVSEFLPQHRGGFSAQVSGFPEYESNERTT